jgi:molybdate transport system ATP-binding protein
VTVAGALPQAAPVRVDLTVRRGDFELAVADTFAPGEVVAVLGPNGSGKSTLLRALAGLTPVTTGRISVGPAVVDDASAGRFVAPEERRVGVVFQDYRLFDHLSAVDNVAFGPRARGRSRREARSMAAGLLTRLGLADRARARPPQLSGGQAQRVALARALATEPDLLLLDEPLAALDAQTKLDVRAILRRHLSEFAGPAVLVTHDPLDALLLADRLLVLEDGRVRQSAAPGEVAARPATDYVARLIGTNLIRGVARDGRLRADTGAEVTIADRRLAGPALAVLRPSAITVHTRQPEPSSARNRWRGHIDRISLLGDRVRLDVHGELTLIVDITPVALRELGLSEGAEVWLSAKATEIDGYAAEQPRCHGRSDMASSAR